MVAEISMATSFSASEVSRKGLEAGGGLPICELHLRNRESWKLDCQIGNQHGKIKQRLQRQVAKVGSSVKVCDI